MTLIPALRKHLWATGVCLQQFSNTELCFVLVLSSAFCISPDTRSRGTWEDPQEAQVLLTPELKAKVG